ncbi:hypothetical protein E4U26_004642 [Claviceps purpurea]|nr:hypothetical protein E4U26_004642 [Claviceps purpurea]
MWKTSNHRESACETNDKSRIGPESSSSTCMKHHRQGLPDFIHPLHYDATSGPPPESPAIEKRAPGEQGRVIRRDSIARQPSPPPPPTPDITFEDASLSLSPELPLEIDPQELLDFLREFDQDRQRSKQTVKTTLGPQSPAIICDKHSTHTRLLDGIDGQSHCRRTEVSMTSDIPVTPLSQKQPSQHTTPPDHLQPQSPSFSTHDSIPSVVVNLSDSPTDIIIPESRYCPPGPFIGRFASGLNTSPWKGKKRRKRFRPDIRALPNYEDDPIEEDI